MPKRLAACLNLSISSAKRGKPKEEIQKYFGRKKRLESLAQVYIDDIHVMYVFSVGHTM